MKEQHSALTRSTKVHSPSPDTKSRELLSETCAGTSRRILWIDGVGGFLLIDRDEILIGQAISGSPLDVCIVGDLSRQACALRRADGDYLIQPLHQSLQVNGETIERPQLLSHNSVIQLGSRVKLKFTKPTPLSSTARLDLVSLNHFKPHVDGVLLLADSCILGPSASSHVVCPTWKSELLMFRHSGEWHFRSLDEVDVDGSLTRGQIPMKPGMRMRGEDFSLSIE